MEQEAGAARMLQRWWHGCRRECPNCRRRLLPSAFARKGKGLCTTCCIPCRMCGGNAEGSDYERWRLCSRSCMVYGLREER